jgi:ribonuclease E
MKTMLINVTHAEESRVGIVEDGQLESFEIESLSREYLKGNIYKGIVRRIHPAIEAAFVDIGAGRDAFLPLDEICFRNLPPGRNGATGERGRRRIKDVLKSGDEVLVQITKEQFTNKPPTVSSFYSLPGRYLVLLPGSEDAGISRKIEGEDRARVRELLGNLRPPPGCGIIIRTAAGFDEDQSAELARDLSYLQRLWESIEKNADTKRAPALVYREHDLVLRNIRDYFTPDINEIYIDDPEVFERARDFLRSVMPGKEHILRLYQEEAPIFSHFGLEDQIESIYRRRVPLKSGGSIVIEATEAMTSIDVNSGGSMRGASQEDTAYRTNMEAAREIARQLRLRDLGGIIVIDFIDMRMSSHISEVERTLRDAMRPDKARHDIGRISRLGLVEISRQRLRPAAAASAYAPCPVCEGHGAIRTTESAALVVLRQIQHRIAKADVGQMKVSVPHDVAMYLLNQKRDDLALIERRYAARIHVLVSPKLMPHQSEIEVRTRDVIVPLPVVRPGEVAIEEGPVAGRRTSTARRGAVGRSTPSRTRRPAIAARDDAGPAEATAENGEARPRRRRRRGGRGRRGEGAEEAQAGTADEGAEAAIEDLASEAGEERRVAAREHDAGEPPIIELASIGAPVDADEVGRAPAEAATGGAGAVMAEERAPRRSAPEPPRPVSRRPDDPRFELYLLHDEPVGMRPTPVEDPLVAFEHEALVGAASAADAAPGSGAAEGAPGARRRRRRGGRRGGRGRRRTAGSESAREDDGGAGDREGRDPASRGTLDDDATLDGGLDTSREAADDVEEGDEHAGTRRAPAERRRRGGHRAESPAGAEDEPVGSEQPVVEPPVES